MNEQIQQIIKSEVEKFEASIRWSRQHPISKKHAARLNELGITGSFGNSTAQHLIKCAEDNGKVVGGFNAYGEGDTAKMQPHALYLALNNPMNKLTAADTWEFYCQN